MKLTIGKYTQQIIYIISDKHPKDRTIASVSNRKIGWFVP